MPTEVNLKEQLNNRGLGKAIILEIADNLDETSYKELLTLIVEGKPPINQKAAWLFNHAAKLYPTYFENNYSYIINHLPRLTIDGCKRDVLRGMLSLPIQEEKLGLLVDTTMKWLSSFDVAVAVKYNSMRTLERIVEIYPDLENEFHSVLKRQLNLNTPPFKRQVLKLLSKK